MNQNNPTVKSQPKEKQETFNRSQKKATQNDPHNVAASPILLRQKWVQIYILLRISALKKKKKADLFLTKAKNYFQKNLKNQTMSNRVRLLYRWLRLIHRPEAVYPCLLGHNSCKKGKKKNLSHLMARTHSTKKRQINY